jgi:hypothetical protein
MLVLQAMLVELEELVVQAITVLPAAQVAQVELVTTV